VQFLLDLQNLDTNERNTPIETMGLSTHSATLCISTTSIVLC